MCTTVENGANQIVYRVATSEDRYEILDFLRKHYYPEEPITNGNEPKLPDTADEEFSMSVIDYGMTVVALDACNGNIVGAIMGGPIGPSEADEMMEESKMCEKSNKKWSEILLLLAHLEQNANIYKRYNVTKALHIHVLGVDKQYRGKSIGVNLMERCFDVGKSLEFPLVTADCTSVYSIKVAEKLQMDCINQLAYAEFKDNLGRQLFSPPSPHTHVKTFAKHL